MSEKQPLIIYHANCMDGFAAACVVAKHLHGRGEYVACQYGDPVPDVDGREVYIVDFSWKLPEMLDIVKRCKRLVWIDHHKTSAEYWPHVYEAQGAKGAGGDTAHNQRMCGALLTWDTLFGNDEVPDVLRYVNDRDLWLKHLPDTDAVHLALSATYMGEDPARLAGDFLYNDVWKVKDFGRSLKKMQAKRIDAADNRAQWLDYDTASTLLGYPGHPVTGHCVCVVNLSPESGDISEMGDKMCREGASVAVMYFETLDGWVHSLRSRPDSEGNCVDVSAIAKRFGGGGHKQAAGFKHDFPITMWSERSK